MKKKSHEKKEKFILISFVKKEPLQRKLENDQELNNK